MTAVTFDAGGTIVDAIGFYDAVAALDRRQADARVHIEARTLDGVVHEYHTLEMTWVFPRLFGRDPARPREWTRVGLVRIELFDDDDEQAEQSAVTLTYEGLPRGPDGAMPYLEPDWIAWPPRAGSRLTTRDGPDGRRRGWQADWRDVLDLDGAFGTLTEFVDVVSSGPVGDIAAITVRYDAVRPAGSGAGIKPARANPGSGAGRLTTDACAACAAPVAAFRCARCSGVAYCGAACQRAGWEAHGGACGAIDKNK